MDAEVDLNNLNNKQMVQYIKRLQAALEQYQAQKEASLGAPDVKEGTSFEEPRTRMEMLHTKSKGKTKVEDEEPSNETPRDVD